MNEKDTGIEIKYLPRNSEGELKREFIANGKRYKIRSYEDSMSINRANAYSAYNAMMTLNFEDPQGMIEYIAEMRETLGSALGGAKSNIAKLAAQVETLYNSIITFSKEKYRLSQKLCTIFIVRENEDLKTYSAQIANEKMEDWANEGFHRDDFLDLAVTFSQEYKNAILRRLQLGKEETAL
jgi:hypothetical protein